MLALWLIAVPLAAQEWNSPAAIDLVRRATERRRPDTGLHSYRTTAHGMVFFLAQVGPGLTEPPHLVKADQLDVEVYWQAPGLSKQRILGWRDGRFLPTDVIYHRDHLGIVTNNFGDRIRIGEGDEVRDVVHPLSPLGTGLYDYALGDTITVQSSGRTLRLVKVEVRPRNFDQPLVVGTLFLDAESADLVRFRFSFTPVAYLDPNLEDITVALENALYEGRYWLPFQQEIEIRRQVSWLDLPTRGIIRGRWQVGDYTFDVEVPDSILRGPAIGGPLSPSDSGYTWDQPLATAIGDAATPVNRQEMTAIREEIRSVVGTHALDGLPATRIGSNSISDLVHVNRVEGLALGMGVRFGLGAVEIRPAVGYGFSSEEVTGGVAVTVARGGTSLTAFGNRAVRDFSDYPVISPLLNSIMAQESGNDHGDWVLLASGGLRLRRRLSGRSALELEGRAENSRSMAVATTPAQGSYRPNPPLGAGTYGIGRLRLERAAAGVAPRHDLYGAVTVEAGGGPEGYARGVVEGTWVVPLGPGSLQTSTILGAGTTSLPAYRNFIVGGRGTLLGEPYRAYGGSRMAWASVEWRIPIPFPSLGLGAYASTGKTATLAPFVAAGWVDRPAPGMPWKASPGVRPVAGLASEWFMQLIRVEAGVALRTGEVAVTVDVNRLWWGIL